MSASFPWRTHQRQLRRHCERVLGALDLPRDCEISVLCERLSEQRGRPIQLFPVALQELHLFGAWLKTSTADVIIYELNTSKPHQDHIVAHEIAHMICGHHAPGGIDDDLVSVLFPDIDPRVVREMLGRGGYSSAQEKEAEIIASVILERVNRRKPDAGWAVPTEDAATVARIQRTLVNRGDEQDRP